MKSPEMGGSSPEKESAGIKEKLANLEQYMPGQQEIVYRFAHFLADRVKDTIGPEEFDLMAELTLCDLEKGEDGFTGEPIQDKLVGYSNKLYSLLRLYVPRIKEVVFEKEK